MKAVRHRSRRDLHPWAIQGRLLTCTSCGHHVDLVELPEPWIDERSYVCGQCLPVAAVLAPAPEPHPPPRSLRLVDYDPRTAPWPEGF